MLDVSSEEKSGKYVVRLSGSITNLILIGIVSYLKDSKYLRPVAGFLGFASLIVGAITYIIPEWMFNKISMPLLLFGVGLTFASVLSGKNFHLIIGETREVEERKEAEEHIKDNKDPYSSLDLDVKRLNEYYAINQSQARGSFRWAIFAMLCGFFTIIGGVWFFYLDKETPNTFMASLTTAAGLFTNFISGTFLYLHNKTQRRSLYYYGQLIRIQQLGLAIRLAENHEENKEKTDSKNKVINELLQIVKTTAELDAKSINKETG